MGDLLASVTGRGAGPEGQHHPSRKLAGRSAFLCCGLRGGEYGGSLSSQGALAEGPGPAADLAAALHRRVKREAGFAWTLTL